MTRNSVLLLAAVLCSVSLPVLADDWRATKLRGVVLELVDGDWRQLSRGDIVPDDRVVRTLRTGRVTFQRGNETVDLGPETQVQIFDRSGKPFTTVKQYFGEVSVEADVREVQHFAVQTQFLTAVVKGTKFTVTADGRGAEVAVQRGHVAVKDADSRQSTVVSGGQSAASGDGTPLYVSGAGELPVVRDTQGRAVADASVGESPKAARQAEKAAERAERGSGSSGQSSSAGSNNGQSGGSSGNSGNSGNGNSGGTNSGNGNSGNSGNGNSGNGNSGNGNSGNGNSGNGNSGNWNSGNSGGGNSGRGSEHSGGNSGRGNGRDD